MNNCEAGRTFGARDPNSTHEPSLVALIAPMVYPFAGRCYKPLMHKTIATKVTLEVLDAITFITDLMDNYTMQNKWPSKEEMLPGSNMTGYLFDPFIFDFQCLKSRHGTGKEEYRIENSMTDQKMHKSKPEVIGFKFDQLVPIIHDRNAQDYGLRD